MLTKEIILKTVDNMPETFTVDDLLDKIILLQKIENGKQQSKEGKVFSTEEAKQKLDKWLS